MTEKHFIISLTEDLTVNKTSGKLTRNSNGTQWIDVELDDWKLNEGEALYIELSHLNTDSGLTSMVGPLSLLFNPETKRYVTLAPPELITVAGKWNYSIELRYDISEDSGKMTTVSEISVADANSVLYKTTVIHGRDKETDLPTEITVKTDKDGDVISTSTVLGTCGEKILKYNSLTSAVYQLEVVDTVISSSASNSYTREAELLTAAKTLTDAIFVGHSAEVALAAAQAALESEQNAALSESNAADSAASAGNSAQAAAISEMNAATSATAAASALEEATRQAENAATSATAAEAAQTAATEQAQAAANSAAQAATSEQNAADSAAGIENAKKAAEASATEAHGWADVAKGWAEYGIKINTEFTALDELPNPGDSHFIYLIPNGSTNENSYDEYIWADSKNAYEKIGTTEIDLSAYATKTLLVDGLDEKVSKSGDTMKGALKTPKLNVDKIARNEANNIYIEPPTTFHSAVTFESNSEFSPDKKLTVSRIGANSGDLLLESSLDLNRKNIRNAISVSADNVKTALIESGGSDAIIVDSSLDFISTKAHDIEGVDNIHSKTMHTDKSYSNYLYFNSDTPNGVGGYDPYIYHTNSAGDRTLNIKAGTNAKGEYGNIECFGNLNENGQRVYSPNNKPTMHLELVQKSTLTNVTLDSRGSGGMIIVRGKSREAAKANLEALGYNFNGIYLAQRVDSLGVYPFELVRIYVDDSFDDQGEYLDSYCCFYRVTQGGLYYNIYALEIVVD